MVIYAKSKELEQPLQEVDWYIQIMNKKVYWDHFFIAPM